MKLSQYLQPEYTAVYNLRIYAGGDSMPIRTEEKN
jgi:hypothetical protein